MINKEKVTVLMPVRNAEKYVKEAMDSILGQSFADFEFLILLHKSKDQTEQIIRRYRDKRVKVVRATQEKFHEVLNFGLKISKGEYIARMDGDDVAYKNRLRLQVNFLNQHPTIDLVGTACDLIDEDGKVIGENLYPTKSEAIKRVLAVTNPVIHPSVMFRKASIIKIGGYRSSPAEDLELWIRLCPKGEPANLPQKLMAYRINPSGASTNNYSAMVEKAANDRSRYWKSFGKSGPAPLRDWPLIWPAKINKKQKKFFAQLHYDFFVAYRVRRQFCLSFVHLCAAVRQDPLRAKYYFYFLTFIMPQKFFTWLKDKIKKPLT